MQARPGAGAVVVGNIVLDEVRRGGVLVRHACGGTATYASLALRALGADVALVGSVGAIHAALLREPLERAGVDLACVRVTSDASTSYLLDYRDERRDVRLLAPGRALAPSDVPPKPAGVAFVHVGSVAGEARPGAVEALAAWGVPLGVDLHALRAFDADGNVRLVSGAASGLPFRRCDTVKGALGELRAFAPEAPTLGEAMHAIARLGVAHVLATDGPRGALVLCGERYLLAPAHPAEEIDATGAGDVFLAAFLWARHAADAEPATAAAFAAAAASFVVQGPGTTTLGTSRDVAARQREVHVREPTPSERAYWGV